MEYRKGGEVIVPKIPEVEGLIIDIEPTLLGVNKYVIGTTANDATVILGTPQLDRLLTDELGAWVKIIHTRHDVNTYGFPHQPLYVTVWRPEEPDENLRQ